MRKVRNVMLGVLVAGSLVSALVLTPLIAWIGGGLSTPLAPEPSRLVADMTAGEIWARYVRYIGAGAVAVAGIAGDLESCGGRALVAVRGLDRAVGCDIESVERRSDAFLARFMGRQERELAVAFGPEGENVIANVAWAVREAAVKARRGRLAHARSATVDFGHHSGRGYAAWINAMTARASSRAAPGLPV